MTRAALTLAIVAAACPAFLHAATIEVVVGNVRSDQGFVLVAVCTAGDFLRNTCAHVARAPARSGEVVVPVAGVPPGIYAVQAFQDEDNSGKMRKGLFGIPQGGIGFSNDAPFRFGPPSFGDAAFRLDADGGRIHLKLRYFD